MCEPVSATTAAVGAASAASAAAPAAAAAAGSGFSAMSALTAGATVANAGLSIMGALSKNQAAGANYAQTMYNSNVALGQSYNGIEMKQRQAADKAAIQSFDVLKAMAQAKSKANVAAGEAGVGGVSFANLLSDFEMKRSEAKAKTDANYASEVQAGEDEKRAVRARAEGVINSQPKANDVATVAEIGSAGVNAGLRIFDLGEKRGWWKA